MVMVMIIVTSTHLTASSSDTFRLLFTRAVRARAWVTQTLVHYKVVIAMNYYDQLIPPERGLPKGSQPQTLEVGCLAQIQQLLNQPPEQKD